jgi:bifunctional non-homologous end joining protein LigD
MLSAPGEVPRGQGWAFEVKWDGFRALVSTESGVRVRSRRGWDMTPKLRELESLPPGLVLDCEVVAFNDAGDPDWPLLCRRVLHGESAIPIQLMIFDLLAVHGECLLGQPYERRRTRLEGLHLHGPAWMTPDTFDDGAALYAGVCERVLEGIVAKPLRSTYRPGKRRWIKIKNPAYWRRESEFASMQRHR